MGMATFDLHEVIIGHITPGICRITGCGVTIVRIGVEICNIRGFLVYHDDSNLIYN